MGRLSEPIGPGRNQQPNQRGPWTCRDIHGPAEGGTVDIPGCRRGLAERPAKKPLSERSVRAPIPPNMYKDLHQISGSISRSSQVD